MKQVQVRSAQQTDKPVAGPQQRIAVLVEPVGGNGSQATTAKQYNCYDDADYDIALIVV